METRKSKALLRGGHVPNRALLFVVLCGVSLEAPCGAVQLAAAASFDCSRAKVPREKVICADTTLSDLDSQLGYLYLEHRAKLSPAGQGLLLMSQQSWLHFIAIVCAAEIVAKPSETAREPFCLRGKYQERLTQLDMAGKQIGPYIFNRSDAFTASPSSDNTGEDTSGFYVTHSAYPQIDQPLTAQTKAWNIQAAQGVEAQIGSAEDQSDSDADYEIGLANDKLISLRRTTSYYPHGRSHGIFSISIKNTVFPEMRDLTAADLFGTTKRWIAPLQALFVNIGRTNPDRPVDDTSESDVESIVIDPSRWELTVAGLKVSFNAYEGGCYACTPNPIVVQWRALKGMIVWRDLIPADVLATDAAGVPAPTAPVAR